MSNPWVTLVGDDLASSMTATELTDFSSTDATLAMPQRVTAIASDLVAEIRGMIETWSTNTLSADPEKIPPGFKAQALAIGRWRLLSTIPGYQPGDARKLEYENAVSFFKDVARGIIRPGAADDAVPAAAASQKPSGVEVVSGPGSRTGRTRMDGI